MSLRSLKDVYVDQLKDMYSAEKQTMEALPAMIDAAQDADLVAAFQEHLGQTEFQMQTVREILDDLDENPTSTVCKAMEGLLKEGSEIINEKGYKNAKDAALILAAQKVEHYEIATYGGLVTFARTLGYKDAARKLQMCLDQEYDADQKLDDIAMGVHKALGVNLAAAQ